MDSVNNPMHSAPDPMPNSPCAVEDEKTTEQTFSHSQNKVTEQSIDDDKENIAPDNIAIKAKTKKRTSSAQGEKRPKNAKAAKTSNVDQESACTKNEKLLEKTQKKISDLTNRSQSIEAKAAALKVQLKSQLSLEKKLTKAIAKSKSMLLKE